MSRRRHEGDKSAPEAAEAGGSVARLLVESVLWIWALSVIGYFYYTREFHVLLSQAWEQSLG